MKSPVGLLTAVAAALGAAGGCGNRTAAPARPSVVLVVVDQLRKDSADAHLTRVNALATRGVVADQMRAAAPWTYPSVISLMSGLYPQQHGADGHRTAKRLSSFDPELPLLSGLLRKRGYRTAAFVTNPYLHTFNPFHSGFDHYDISFIESQGSFSGAGRLVWGEGMFADSVNAAVLAHLRSTPRRGPEFTYVHYIDVHGPWRGAPFISEELLDRTGLLPLVRAQEGKSREEIERSIPWNGERERAFYEESIRYVDGRIVELYERFMRRYDGELIFIVTSDHGRALGEDEDVGEGHPLRQQKRSLHHFNLRVPFCILPSRAVSGPVLIAGPTSNVDVMPTLLEWLDVPAPTALPGRSLLPILRGGRGSDDRALYARMSAFGYRSDCVIADGRKYVRWFEADGGPLRTHRVYDLGQDPQEVAPRDGPFARLRARLEAEAGDHGVHYEAVFEDVDASVREKLRSLGYLR